MRTRPAYYGTIFLVQFLILVVLTSCVLSEGNLTAREYESRLRGIVDSGIGRILPFVMRSSTQSQISAPCAKGLLRIVFGVRQLEGWAIKMLDSWGKVPGGLLEGTLSSLGSFDQCLDTLLKSSEGEVILRGQYCTVQLYPPASIFDQKMETPVNEEQERESVLAPLIQQGKFLRNAYLRMGVCLPESCTKEDVSHLLQKVTSSASLGVSVRRCETAEPLAFSTTHISILTILGVIVLLVVISSFLDLYACGKRCGVLLRLSRCFSLRQGLDSLMAGSPTSAIHSPDLTCLEGIRFFTSLWIVLGHCYLLPLGVHYLRFRRVLGFVDFQKDFAFAIIGNFYLSVDTFFLISGLLLVYSRRRILNDDWKKIRPGLTSFIFRRLLRFVPVYALTVSLFLLLPILGSGPFWQDAVTSQADICLSNWWANLLFIQNFWPIKENCLLHSWYLAASMQIHVLSFLILYFLFKNVWGGLLVNAVYFLLGILLTAVVTFWYKLRPTMDALGGHEALDGVTSLVYIRPYAHLPSFCVGVALGVLLLKKPNLHIAKVYLVTGSLVSLAVSTLVVFGLYNHYNGWTLSREAAVAYAALHRPAWSLCSAFFLYLCATGHCGVIRRFLGWSAFAPLGRLSYSAYLIHPLVILYQLGRLRERNYLGHFEMILNSTAVACVSYLLAVPLYLLAESPSQAIDKILFRSRPDGLPRGALESSQTGLTDGRTDKTRSGMTLAIA